MLTIYFKITSLFCRIFPTERCFIIVQWFNLHIREEGMEISFSANYRLQVMFGDKSKERDKGNNSREINLREKDLPESADIMNLCLAHIVIQC